jgi:phosphoribosylamine---glycine ligase
MKRIARTSESKNGCLRSGIESDVSRYCEADLRVMLIGAGGREHALAWKIAKSQDVSELICVPGNPGMALESNVSCRDADATNVGVLVSMAEELHVDFVVIGPEAPLVAGLADRMKEKDILVFGPNRRASLLEGSKAFAKTIMKRNRIPTAPFEIFDDAAAALQYVRANRRPLVIKADGLASGKGVVPCRDTEEAEVAIRSMLVDDAFGAAGRRIVVEEFLQGEEASCIAITDGKELKLFPSAQDHKRVFDGDQGPNTGGMGAYSPASILDSQTEETIVRTVFEPLLVGLASEGIHFRGVLYAGLMIDKEGFNVLEFNARFGDPETQVLLPRLRSDLVPALHSVARGTLGEVAFEWDARPAVCVVLASEGYPGPYPKGKKIEGLDAVACMENVILFHAGTRREGEEWLTNGGRVLGVTALGNDLEGSVERAYEAVSKIHFDGMMFRKDIAHRALRRRGGWPNKCLS